MSENQQPRAIIRGKLRLTREQENRVMQVAITRRQQVLQEMGWITGANDGAVSYDGWLEKRRVAWAEYRNDFTHRLNRQRYSALYALYNSSVNVPKRAVRMFGARACDNIVNTDPWVGMKPEGEEDADPAVKLAERLFGRRVNDAGMKELVREALEQAAVSGEAVVKIARKPKKKGPKRGRVWISGGDEVIDEPSGQRAVAPVQDVLDLDNEPVSEHDPWEADANEVGVERLRRQPEVKKPVGARLSDDVRPLKQRQEWGELDVAVIPYQDFIISPNAESIALADYREHSFSWEEGVLRGYIAGNRLSEEAKAWLKTIHQADGKAKTESERVKAGDNARYWIDDVNGIIPKVLMAESWMRFDLNDDGEHIIEICLLWNVRNQYPVGYDYMEEATSLDEKVPFEVIRIIPAKDCWHGIGFYELLSNEHSFIDRQWNRIDGRSGTSGVFKWHKQGAIIEIERGLPFELNSTRVYTVKAEVVDPSKAFGFTEMPKMDENIWKMLTQAMQNAWTMSGNMQPGDSATSDLNQSDTLGEQELLNQEGDLLNGSMVQFALIGITDSLKGAAWVVFKNFNIEDVRLLMGAEKADKLAVYLSPNITNLLYHLKPTLTKQQNRQMMASISQAMTLVVGQISWRELRIADPDMAERAKPLYEQALAIHDVENPANMLTIPPPPPAQPALTNGNPATNPGVQPAAPPALPAQQRAAA